MTLVKRAHRQYGSLRLCQLVYERSVDTHGLGALSCLSPPLPDLLHRPQDGKGSRGSRGRTANETAHGPSSETLATLHSGMGDLIVMVKSQLPARSEVNTRMHATACTRF